MKYKSISNQNGVASIIFTFFMLGLTGFFVFCYEYSLVFQNKANLDDSMERSSIVLSSANPREHIDSESIANGIAGVYLPDFSSFEISVDEVFCDTVYGVNCQLPSKYDRHGSYFREVRVSSSLFLDKISTGVGGDSKINMAGKAVARRSETKSIDVGIAIDFSGSMSRDWDGRKKYEAAVDVLTKLYNDISEFNKNKFNNTDSKMAFVPFNALTSEGYTNTSSLDPISIASNVITNPTHVMMTYPGYLPIGREQPLSQGEDISYINSWKPSGNTASYQGLIRAADIISNGSGAKKLLILISDGADNGRPETADPVEDVYLSGLCRNISERLKGKSGENTKIALIHFNDGYGVDNFNVALEKCVLDAGGDIFLADDYNDVYDDVYMLWAEQVGHSFNARYR